MLEGLKDKASQFAIAILQKIVPVILIALAGWIWNTNIRIAELSAKIEQDRIQWQVIRENSADIANVKLRLGIVEKIQDYSVLSGIIHGTAKDVPDDIAPLQDDVLSDLANQKKAAETQKTEDFIKVQQQIRK